MKRFEYEDHPPKPADFDGWLSEMALLGDSEGQWALIGMWFYSPRECCAYLVSLPGVWQELLSRAAYADAQRYGVGITVGRDKARSDMVRRGAVG